MRSYKSIWRRGPAQQPRQRTKTRQVGQGGLAQWVHLASFSMLSGPTGQFLYCCWSGFLRKTHLLSHGFKSSLRKVQASNLTR